MLRINKKMFIVVLSSIVNASNNTKCISLNNQKCEIQPTHWFTSSWIQSRISLLSICG